MFVDYSKLSQNFELRTMAREQLKGNWGKAILACFLYSLILGIIGAIPFVGWLGALFIGGAFTAGLYGFFLKLRRFQNPAIENIFDGFKFYGSTLALQFLIAIFVFLWSLLLIIPGIIASLSYSQAFYILYDNPEIGAMEALNRSKALMKGQKGKLFLLCLSFIGWALLCVLTLGIGYLWLIPYIQSSMANFHDDIMAAVSDENSFTQTTLE